MSRSLVGVFLAALVVLGVPVTAEAAGDTPVIFASSTSYAGQPRPYTITVFNRLDSSKLTATISGRSMSCRPAGAINGLGTWKCTYGSRLGIGSSTITARASGGGRTRSSSKTINVSSSFAITGSSGTVAEGQSYQVTGRYDGSGFSVSARASAGGSTVQSGVGCAASGTTFTCTLRAGTGASASGTTYTVTVTESGSGSRSDSTTVRVIGKGSVGPPTFTSITSVRAAKQPITVKGRASGPGQKIQLAVDPPRSGADWSSPTASCTSTSNLTWSCKLPAVLAPGKHTIAARAVDSADPSRVSPTALQRITVKAAAVPAVTPTPTPTPTVTPTPVEQAPPPKAAPPQHRHGGISDLLELLILALAVAAIARPGPLSRVFAGRSVAFADVPADPGVTVRERVGRGDFSPTWAAFGHEATDFWSRTAPVNVAPYSPFLGRLAIDGVSIRAIFGTLWYLFPISGIALGVAAAQQTDFVATAPPLSLVVAILVVSCFDAFAGFLASVAFGVMVLGDLTTPGAVVVLALGFLWTALPLVASTFRPLRRTGDASLRYGWDRLADLAITAVVCGWVAERITASLDVLGDKATGLPTHAGTVALAAGGAIAVRVLLEHATDVWWPERLRFTEIEEPLPEPGLLVRLAGLAVRLGVLGFFGHVFLGGCWELWVGLVLFALPDVVGLLHERGLLRVRLPFPLPTGLTALLLLVVVGTALVALVISGDGDLDALRSAFVAASLVPGLLGSAYALRGEPGERSEVTWDLQIAGAGLLVTTLVIATIGYNF
ncbi:MAG: hypothetical protein ACJ72D_05745 [Marmoricola sp.]